MGWYHVNRIGKGICLGDVDKIHYNEDFIAKHTPTKDEALKLKLREKLISAVRAFQRLQMAKQRVLADLDGSS